MKGKSGSVRMKSLDASGLAAMERHEKRLDYAGSKRAIRDVPPLVYSPYGDGLDLEQSYAAHVEGTKRNKGGRALARHGFLQFPTDLPITPENEQQMLDEAVAFINATHGGRAVFRARLDRDEAGRHGVDVFFAPKYEKKTRRGKVVEDWISLSKFGKELALERFGERQKKEKKLESGLFEPVFDKTGKPVMERCDSPVFQGRALQDLWTEHLRDRMGLEWVERGKVKVGRDQDRLEPEEYKIAQEREKLEAVKADLAAKVRELDTREIALAEKEAASVSRSAAIGEFVRAFRSGEIAKVIPSSKNPGKLTFTRPNSLSDDRKARLSACWREIPAPMRTVLGDVSSMRDVFQKEALREVSAAFNGLIGAWAVKEIGPKPDKVGSGEWTLLRPVDEARKACLAEWVQGVGVAVERVVRFLIERLGVFADDLDERRKAAKAVEIEDNWDDSPSLGM